MFNVCTALRLNWDYRSVIWIEYLLPSPHTSSPFPVKNNILRTFNNVHVTNLDNETRGSPETRLHPAGPAFRISNLQTNCSRGSSILQLAPRATGGLITILNQSPVRFEIHGCGDLNRFTIGVANHQFSGARDAK